MNLVHTKKYRNYFQEVKENLEKLLKQEFFKVN